MTRLHLDLDDVRYQGGIDLAASSPATIIEAYNACNIGTIVHVIGLYSGKSRICAPEGDVIWRHRPANP